MNTLITVVFLTGQAWAQDANGERRALNVGDRLRTDETLITESGTRIDLDFGDNKVLTLLGEQQVTAEKSTTLANEVAPLDAREPTEADRRPQSDQEDPTEGHNFVELVRIGEIIEADGITPVTVARLHEILRPLGMSLPERAFGRDERMEHRGDDQRFESGRSRQPEARDELPESEDQDSETENEPPVARDDSATIFEDTRLSVSSADGLLTNDFDPDGDTPLVITGFTIGGQTYNPGDTVIIPEIGELTLNSDGSYEFEPEPGYTGDVPTVTYTVADSDGAEDTADLNIVVEPLVDNDRPLLDITLSSPEQVSEGDTITVTASVEDPVQGNPLIVTLDNGQIITIPVGASSGSIDVDSRPDDIYAQGDATASFEIVSATGGSNNIDSSSPGSTTSTTIVDTIDSVYARITVSESAIYEGDTLTYTVELVDGNGAPVTLAEGKEVTVNLLWSGQAANADDLDNFDSRPTSVTIQGGESQAPAFTVTTLIDSVTEISEPLTVTITQVQDTGAGLDFESLHISASQYTVTSDILDIPVVIPDTTPTVAVPGAGGATTTVFESGLPTGTEEATAKETTSGTIDFTARNGLAPTDPVLLGGHVLTEVSQTFADGLTAYYEYDSTTAVGTIHYSYTLPAVTTGDNTRAEFDIVITDSSDDVSPANTLVINIINDAPIAQADSNSVTEGATLSVNTADGVIDNDQSGADGWAIGGAVVGVVAGTNSGNAASGNVGASVAGTYGTLTLNADGSYTYVASPDSTASDVQDVFTYTVRDADGDESTTTLTIDVANVTVAPTDTTGIVDEAGLATGTNAASNVESIVNASLEPAQAGWTIDTEQSGTTALGTWTVRTDGTFDYTLNNPTTDEAGPETDSFSYTVVDSGGNTVDNTVTITIIDDQPTVVADNTVVAALEVDETTLGTSASTNFSGLFGVEFGADGAALSDDTVYTLTIGNGNDSGLIDTATDQAISLSDAGNGVIEGRNTDGDLVFEVSLNSATGEITLEQSRAVEHSDSSDANDAVALATNALTLGVTVEDGDGDTASDSIAIGDRLTFLDDGPSISVATPAFNPGNLQTEDAETDGGTSTATIGYADAFSVGTKSGGADGEASVSWTYELDLTGNGSTNLTSGDDDITLAVESGAVVGKTPDDTEIFRVSVDANGTVTLTQSGPIDHDDAADAAEIKALTADLISLTGTATITDGDNDTAGDSQTINLGNIQFADDGPSIGTPENATVNEANLPAGSDPDATALTKTGSLSVATGADSDSRFDTTFANNQAALDALNLTSGGVDVIWALDPDAHVLTASAGATTVFTATITNPGSASAGYKFDLFAALDGDGSANIALPFNFLATDADEDTAEETFTVTVLDDTPSDRAVEVDEDDSVTFNTSADATDLNTVISSPPAYGSTSVDSQGQITYTPDANYSGSDEFTYTTTADDGSAITRTVTVTVNPLADAPTITATSPNLEVNEDTSIALGLIAPGRSADQTDQNTANANDGDNPELLGPVTLSGIPAGAQLLDAAGDVVFTATGADIVIDLSDSGNQINDLPATTLSLTEAEYEALQILPPPEQHENISVTAKVSSFEVDENGDRLPGVSGNESTVLVEVDVKAVTDPVELSFTDDTDTFDQEVEEDTPFDLSTLLKVAYPPDHAAANEVQGATSSTDIDGSEERWFEVSGLPVGAFINGTEVTAADQVIRIDAPDLSTSDNSLPEINFTAPSDFSGEASNITITLKAQDDDDDSTVVTLVEQASVTLNLTVQPTVDDLASDDAETEEDTAVMFLQNLAPGDGDGSESITSLTVKDIPVDWIVEDHNGDPVVVNSGEFSVPVADLSGNYQNYTVKPPGHSSLDAELMLDVVVRDEGNEAGLTAVDRTFTDVPLTVKVTPVAERTDSDTDGQDGNDVNMTTDHEYTTEGEEDQWFTLGTENTFDLAENWSVEDDEQLFAALTPELTATNGTQTDPVGSSFRYSTNGDTSDAGGAWVNQTFGGDAVRVPFEFLDTLQFRAAENFSGQFKINVQAVTVDTDDDAADNTTVEAVSGNAELTNILIKPVADEVTTTVTARVKGNEDEEMLLSIRPSSSDDSETYKVTIDAIPDGAEIRYGADTFTIGSGNTPGFAINDNGDGTWSLEIDGFDSAIGASQMFITPPLHSNVPFQLQVSTVAVDTLTVDGDTYLSESDPFDLTINVTPKGIADPATVNVVAADDQIFDEATVDSAGGVMLSELLAGAAALTDDDGSETLTFKLKDLPGGFGVEGATSLGNGEWVFAPNELAGVKITSQENFSGTSAAFILSSITTEDDGHSLTVNHSIELRVTPSPEATMNLSTTGVEDIPQKLDFSVQQQNDETGEQITGVWISEADLDNATDFTLTYGESGNALDGTEAGVTLEDGWYKLTGAALDSIYLKGDANWHGSDSFTVQYERTDPGNDATVAPVSEMSGNQIYGISVTPDTDQPELTLNSDLVITLEDPGSTVIDLDITNAGSDYDGSEQLTRILLSNVPQGVIVEDADFIGGDQWLFITSDDFNNAINKQITLQVNLVAGDLADHQIDITVTTEDAGNGDSKTANTSITLNTNLSDNGAGGGDTPADIILWEQTNLEPTEDTAFSLDQAFNGQIENGVTDNGFNITLSNVPEGTVIAGMTATTIAGAVVWTASGTGDNDDLQTLLQNISVTPPEDWNNNKGGFDFDAKLTTFIPSGLPNETAINPTPAFDVQPVSDAPDITINAPAVDEGDDLTFTVNISNAADAPNWTLVDGTLYLQLDESGIDGAGTLNDAGGNPLSTTAVTGVSGLSDGNYYVIDNVDPATPVTVTYTPSTDYVDGSVSLLAWAQGTETNSALVATGTATQTGQINPVNSGYAFTVDDATGIENASQQATADKSNVIPLVITDNGLTDNDGSESIGTVLLRDVPNGFLVFVGANANAAVEADLSNNAGGDGTTNTWLLGQNGIPGYVGIMPPQFWSGELTALTLQITSGETSSDTLEISEQTFDLTVEAIANGLNSLSPTPSFGAEGSIIPLNLNHELTDPDDAGNGDQSTETLTLEFTGMGAHAAFYQDGTLISGTGQVVDNGGGNYTVSGLSSAQAETLGFVQASGDLDSVEVRARTEETGGGAPSDWTDWKPIDTSGVTEQFGTAGDDSLLWTGQAIDAFGGTDTIQLRFGENVTGAELATNLGNIETIDLGLAGENAISALTSQDVLDMTDDNAVLTIEGDNVDSVNLAGGDWTQGGDSGGYAVYNAAGGAVVNVSLDIANLTVD